jgi:hypothetical protein
MKADIRFPIVFLISCSHFPSLNASEEKKEIGESHISAGNVFPAESTALARRRGLLAETRRRRAHARMQCHISIEMASESGLDYDPDLPFEATTKKTEQIVHSRDPTATGMPRSIMFPAEHRQRINLPEEIATNEK